MPDIIALPADAGELKRKYFDNGDGSYSESAGITVGNITISPTGLATEATLSTIEGNTSPAALGAEGNLWNATSVLIGGDSAVIHLTAQHYAAIFGHVSGATTISLQLSADNSAFYTVQQDVLAGAADFGFTNLILPIGIYVRLHSSAAATITATLLGSA